MADECCGGTFPPFTGIIRWQETRRWANPHPIGVAVMLVPFFGAAHVLTTWSNLPPDGFSLYYQHAAGLGGLCAFVLGVMALCRFLLRYFTSGVVLATLVTIILGTNLFHYATFDSTFSHAFSFLLITLLLDLTDRWWQNPTWATSLWLSIVAAFVFLTRHPNIVFWCVIPLWDWRRVWSRRYLLAAMLAVTAF